MTKEGMTNLIDLGTGAVFFLVAMLGFATVLGISVGLCMAIVNAIAG
jgi:hypothetical protein